MTDAEITDKILTIQGEIAAIKIAVGMLVSVLPIDDRIAVLESMHSLQTLMARSSELAMPMDNETAALSLSKALAEISNLARKPNLVTDPLRYQGPPES